MDFTALKAAAETMFAEKDWASFIAVITAALKLIFGYVADEEGIDY